MTQTENQEELTLTPEQRQALNKFAAKNGRDWRAKLCDLWWTGRDANLEDGCYLRQIRNQLGPEFIKKFKPDSV